MATRYWVGGTGNWDSSTTTNWSTSSGGSGGASVPTSADDVFFDTSSGGGTVTIITNPTVNSILLTAGTLDANNNNITLKQFLSSGSSARTLNMGTGTWTLTNTGTVWNVITTNLTINASTSVINITDASSSQKQFTGGGFTYGTLLISGTGTGNYVIISSNTFGTFQDTNTSAHNILFLAGTTQTISNFLVNGSVGNLITLNSNSTSTFALIKTGTGVVNSNYLNIQHCVATPSYTWYAGKNSTNNQSVATAGSGWLFAPPPTSYSNLTKNSSTYSNQSMNTSTFINQTPSTSTWTNQIRS